MQDQHIVRTFFPSRSRSHSAKGIASRINEVKDEQGSDIRVGTNLRTVMRGSYVEYPTDAEGASVS